MPIPAVQKKEAREFSVSGENPGAASEELKFISDLGRSLLFSVHPKKVAARVAEAICGGVGRRGCVFVAELKNIGLVSCAFNEQGEVIQDLSE